MKLTAATVTHETEESATTEHLLTYSEEEKQQHEINEANAALLYEPAFIPVFGAFQREYNLTDPEAKLHGFIWFFLSNDPRKRFYFTNSQLARLLNCSEASVTRSVKGLQDKGVAEFSYRIKANGGKIRFVKRFHNPMLSVPRNVNLTSRKHQNDEELKHKIKEKNRDTNVSLGETPQRVVLRSGEVDKVIKTFEDHIGMIPTDRKPRMVAQNIRQMINAFIRRNGELFRRVRGSELTFDYVLSRSWSAYKTKKYYQETEKLETFKLKMRAYLADAEKKLQREGGVYETTEKRMGATPGDGEASDHPTVQDVSDVAVFRTGSNIPGVGGLLRKM